MYYISLQTPLVYNDIIMVAARQTVRSTGVTSNERCIPMEDAINEGQQYDGVYLSLGALRLLQAHPDLMGKNAHVGDQAVVVEHSGCIPEHESVEATTRLVMTPCPPEVAQRCGNCILGHAVGRQLVDVLTPLGEPFMNQHTDCF